METTTDIGAEADSAVTVKTTAYDDQVTIDAGNTSTKTITITDTNTSTDADVLFLDGNGGAVTLTKLSLSGIETINTDDTAAITINASAISGQTIDLVGDDAGDVMTITGSADADIITLANITTSGNQVDVSIDAGVGADTIVLSAATVSDETISYAGDGTDAGDTITSFEVGASADVIDMQTNAAYDGDDTTALTSYVALADAAAWATNTAANADAENDIGLAVISANIATADEAGLEALINGALIVANTAGAGDANANDEAYILVDNGVDTFLFHVDFAATDGTFTAADDTATLMATLSGISDASTVLAANFADFA
jgi:hypothetical protein